MKNKMLLLGAAAALSFSAPAQALPDGWYVSLEGGGNWVQDWDFNLTGKDTPGSIEFDTGWAVLASVGYDFGNWSAEFEAGHRSNKFNQMTSDEAPAAFRRNLFDDVKLEEASFMGNLKYNYPVTEKLTLTLGGGLGVDQARLKLATNNRSSESDDWNFAYQGIASAGYAIGQRSELYIAYRYFRTNSAQFDFRPTFENVYDGDNFQKHTATIGFRYYLNDGAAPAPAAPPPPVPEAGTPSEFIIFFGHNKSDLTPAALDVIKEAAVAAKSGNIANVKLVGHTDRSGSDSYNQALSMRRAKGVKSALVGQGVTEGTISLDGRGESEPMVPTADGVREPQNRRVNITF